VDTGPGGGIVFYYSAEAFTSTGSACGTNCHYLEAAPSDQGTPAWCSNTSTLLNVTATGIGSGMANTTTADSTCTSGAIQVAADYTNNSLSDWFLPSRYELNELCKYARNTGQAAGGGTRCSGGSDATLRGFASFFYWSSSENVANVAWYQEFYNGLQYGTYKTNTPSVRPVRAF
jgi:hypothetical protein